MALRSVGYLSASKRALICKVISTAERDTVSCSGHRRSHSRLHFLELLFIGSVFQSASHYSSFDAEPDLVISTFELSVYVRRELVRQRIGQLLGESVLKHPSVRARATRVIVAQIHHNVSDFIGLFRSFLTLDMLRKEWLGIWRSTQGRL